MSAGKRQQGGLVSRDHSEHGVDRCSSDEYVADIVTQFRTAANPPSQDLPIPRGAVLSDDRQHLLQSDDPVVASLFHILGQDVLDDSFEEAAVSGHAGNTVVEAL